MILAVNKESRATQGLQLPNKKQSSLCLGFMQFY